jgi:pimeloyl-ACP methyl ester carboxylesterase
MDCLEVAGSSSDWMLVPAIQHTQQDERGRFREIFCGVLEARKDSLPDYRPCDETLARVGREPDGTGRDVALGPAHRRLKLVFVPGVGWDCFSQWLAMENTISEHLRRFGYDMVMVNVDGLGSSASNAEKIRNAVLRMPREADQPDLVLLGYSRGAADVLVTLADYPEIRDRVAAVVSLAGAIGGSPLANDTSDNELNLLRHFPGATCKPVDGGALQDLRPEARKTWPGSHTLPAGIAYYSMITFPAPERISLNLRGSYRKLSRVDALNDSQVIFYDQFIPDSTLLAYPNADHWAVAVPVARTHDTVGDLLVDRNAYPREALYEALLRLIEEDLETAGAGKAGAADPTVAPNATGSGRPRGMQERACPRIRWGKINSFASTR